MKKISLVLTLLILITIGQVAFAQLEDNLWIIEMVINEDIHASQVMDALILDEEVYLPLLEVTGLLDLTVDVDYASGTYVYQRPVDQKEVVIDLEFDQILVAGQVWEMERQMYQLNGNLFIHIQDLAGLLHAKLEFDSSKLIVFIDAEYIAVEKVEQANNGFLVNQEQANPEETPPHFTLSNVRYKWTAEKTQERAFADGVLTSEVEDWKSQLSLDAKGSLLDWRYHLAGNAYVAKGQPVSYHLDALQLIYDMDQATFRIGKMLVETEEELTMESVPYYGVYLASHVSPLMRMTNNLITVTGKAPIGSKVILRINQWEKEEYKVTDGTYLFKDVLLSEGNRANELYIRIIKPSGGVEELYRYLACSDHLLNKNEVNYLVQAGKFAGESSKTDPLKAEQESDNYLINSMVYWGVTDETTLDLSWYGEIEDQSASAEDLLAYNYNSLRLYHRLNDDWIARSILYHQYGNQQNISDFGYKLGVDYRDPVQSGGIEYHHEGMQVKDPYFDPSKVYKLYYLRDVTPDSVLEGKFTSYTKMDNDQHFKNTYQLGYKIERKRWNSKLRYTYSQGRITDENSLNASFGYKIMPNFELLHSLSYQSKWNELLTEKVNLGIEGLIETPDQMFIFGLDHSIQITEKTSTDDLHLSYSKLWDLGENEYIQTGVGLQIQWSDQKPIHTIPVKIFYYKHLNNDTKLNLGYEGSWETGQNQEKIDHKLSISIEGAFNIFDGKLVSTSPNIIKMDVGMVSGVVFMDRNRNGVKDEDEEVLTDIPVMLDHKLTYTDQNGEFAFKQVSVGVHNLRFDYNQLPIELTPSVMEQDVVVKSNKLVYEYLGLYIVGSVDGEIQIENVDQKLNLSGIRILINPGGYQAVTNRAGYYYFDQVPPGVYQVTLDPTSLPEWVIQEKMEPQEIEITESGEYLTVDFSLRGNLALLDLAEGKETVPEQLDVVISEPETEDYNDTIIGKEEDLVDITDRILRIDLDTGKGTFAGQELKIDLRVENDQIWAPIRAIAELFGARVYWDQEEFKIYIVDENLNILFDIKLGYVLINGVEGELKHGINIEDCYAFVTLQDLEIIGLSSKVEENMLYIFAEDEIPQE